MKSKLTSSTKLLVLSGLFFVLSFMATYLVAGPNPNTPAREGDYTLSNKSICGLATSPNTVCATTLWNLGFAGAFPKPTRCGSPEHMETVLKEESFLRMMKPDDVTNFCKDWQNAKPEYAIENYDVYFMGWMSVLSGNFWAWLAFPLALIALFFRFKANSKKAVIFSSGAVVLGGLSYIAHTWSMLSGFSGVSYFPILHLSTGFYLWMCSLLLLLLSNLTMKKS